MSFVPTAQTKITPALLAEAHAELVALSNALSHRAAALQKRLDKVEAREAAVEAREAAVQDTEANVEAREVAVARSEKDCAMLRTLLEKEAERLMQAGRERLDAAADAHVQRLQTACGALKQQCEHLRMINKSAFILIVPPGAKAHLPNSPKCPLLFHHWCAKLVTAILVRPPTR